MQATLVAPLEALFPALKQDWAARLRQTPPGTGLIDPEMLVLMIDRTLQQLVAGQGDFAPDVLLGRSGRFRRQPAPCRCGLNLLSDYYLSGARALRAVLPADWGRARLRTLRSFIRLARHETNALCGVCVHRGGPRCRWQSAGQSLKSSIAAAC